MILGPSQFSDVPRIIGKNGQHPYCNQVHVRELTLVQTDNGSLLSKFECLRAEVRNLKGNTCSWPSASRGRCLYFTWKLFLSQNHDCIPLKRFGLYSAYYNGCSRGVSLLVSHSLKVAYVLVFVDPVGRLCILNVTIKHKAFCFIGVYTPNDSKEWSDVFL